MEIVKADIEIFKELRKAGDAQEAKLKEELQASKEVVRELEAQIKDEIITMTGLGSPS